MLEALGNGQFRWLERSTKYKCGFTDSRIANLPSWSDESFLQSTKQCTQVLCPDQAVNECFYALMCSPKISANWIDNEFFITPLLRKSCLC